MIKALFLLKDVVKELKLALVQVRELVMALEKVLETPDVVSASVVLKELKDVIHSIKTKGV